MQDAAAGSRWARWWPAAVIFALTTAILILLTNGLAALGAHDFLVALSREALATLKKWEPHRLAMEIYALHHSPKYCPPPSSLPDIPNMLPTCTWWESLRSAGNWIVRWPFSFITVIAEQFAQSPARAVISSIQLMAGAALALWALNALDKVRGFKSMPGAIVFTMWCVLTLVCATVLAIPLLGIVTAGAWMLRYVIPEHSELSFYAASIVTFFYLFVARSFESGLQHVSSKVVERLLFGRKD